MQKIIKNIITGVTTLTMLASAFMLTPVTVSAFSGGTGTEADPYLISNETDLSALATRVNMGDTHAGVYFKMTNDITLSGTWTSIGNAHIHEARSEYNADLDDDVTKLFLNYEHSFSGVFDGGGYSVHNLQQSITDYQNESVGLFGSVHEGTVKNISVDGTITINASISKPQNAQDNGYGSVVSVLDESVMENCHSSVDIECNTSGVFESSGRMIVHTDYNYTSVEEQSDFSVGGLVGHADRSSIKSSTNAGDITFTAANQPKPFDLRHIGGVVGYVAGTSVTECFNSGNITCNSSFSWMATDNISLFDYAEYADTNGEIQIQVAGIAGTSYPTGTYDENHNLISGYDSKIMNCGNSGNVSAANQATCGITNINNGVIWNCFNTGTITGSPGHPISSLGNDVDNCYYLDTSVPSSAGDIQIFEDEPGTPMTAEQFASGEVAYLLNENSSSDVAWYQTLGADTLPTLDSTHNIVYYNSSGNVYTNNMNKGTMSVKFMGSGLTPSDVHSTAHLNSSNLSSTNYSNMFWVAVTIEKSKQWELITSGVNSIEVAFEYNPLFVEPYTDASDSSANTDARWIELIENGNFATGTVNDTAWWDGSSYKVERDSIVRAANVITDTETDREIPSDSDEWQTRKDSWKMCSATIRLDGSDFSNARLKDLASDSAQYLIKLPFKLKRVPQDGDANQNPIVLSLIRGTETLDIGSGENGTNPHAEWFPTGHDDEENLKYMYDWGGDVTLFNEGSAISNIVAVKPMSGDETEDTEYLLAQDIELQNKVFDAENTGPYYVSVPYETESIRMDVTSASAPTVVANDVTLSVSADSGSLYKSQTFNLKTIDVTTKDTDHGYNNVVTVSADGTTYTVYIRRLLEPKIELNPGNSPYGLIERMSKKYKGDSGWDDDKVQEAKDAFRDSDPRPADAQHPTAWDGGRLHYGADLVPDDGIYFADINNKNSFHYTAAAWEAYDKNYDMDETATFVYIGRTFTDPGIVITDQEGNVVTPDSTNLSKELTVKQLITSSGITPQYNDNEVRDLALTEDATTGKYSLYQNWVRPDKYEIVYTYTYTDINDNTTKTLEVKRPLIVLSQRGDIELTLNVLINPNDISKFSQNFQQFKSRNGIFAWRMADIENTLNPLMNPNDLSTFNQVFQNNTFKNTQYYTYID